MTITPGALSCPGSLCTVGKGGPDFTYTDFAAGTTITIAQDFACVAGMTSDVGPQYINWGAGFGIDLDPDNSNGPIPVQLSGEGVVVRVSNIPEGGLRISVTDSLGGTPGYCANVPFSATTTDTLIPWTDFNTQCWSGTGESLSGAPITTSIQFQIVADMTPFPFDLCVETLGVTVAP